MVRVHARVLVWALSLLALCGLLVPLQARADIWAFMDVDGHAHFSTERLDERYTLYYYNPDAHQNDAAESRQTRARLIGLFEQSPDYKKVQPILRNAANNYGIEFELLVALVATESGFDASVVSSQGAVGLMQIMPNTAQYYGLRANSPEHVVQKLSDPRINVTFGSRYLRDMIRRFPGQLDLALAAYNAGVGSVRTAGDKVPPIKETQMFVRTVLNLHAALSPAPLEANPRHLPSQNFRLKQSRALRTGSGLTSSNP